MKTVKKKVNADGKLVGVIDVPQYENTAEMIKDLSEAKVLALANRQLSSDFTNEYRAAQTREVNPINKLNKLSKTNPELQAQIDKLIAKFAPAPVAASGGEAK